MRIESLEWAAYSAEGLSTAQITTQLWGDDFAVGEREQLEPEVMKGLGLEMQTWMERNGIELCGTVLEKEGSQDEREVLVGSPDEQKAVQKKWTHLPHELAAVSRENHPGHHQDAPEGVLGCGKDQGGILDEGEAIEE